MGDDHNVTDQKIDDLTATVNRLSQQFDDYMTKYPPPEHNVSTNEKI